jgi:hypothetical protein
VTAWWAGLAPAQTHVECGGARHRLRWESGDLHALDHDDLEGERTLAALGGEPCACVNIVDAWARHATNPRLLLLASRGPGDGIRVDADETPWAWATSSSAGGWTSYAPLGAHLMTFGPAGGEPAPDPDDPVPLLSLGGGLADRLVAEVAAHWSDRDAERRAELHAALYGRLLATLWMWLGEPGLELELTMSDTARAIARKDEAIHATLPFSWVSEVWVRGFTVVANRLALSATPAQNATRWELMTVAPDLGAPGRVVLDLPA